MRIIQAIILASLALGCGFANAQTVQVPTDDAAMNAAIEKARSTIDGFWTKLNKHGDNEQNFAVKLAVSDGTNTEHFWCTDISVEGAKKQCAIGNDPELVTNVKLGQRVDIDPAIISDWMYMRDGRIVGGQTIRAIIPMLPADQQEQYKALLADE